MQVKVIDIRFLRGLTTINEAGIQVSMVSAYLFMAGDQPGPSDTWWLYDSLLGEHTHRPTLFPEGRAESEEEQKLHVPKVQLGRVSLVFLSRESL